MAVIVDAGMREMLIGMKDVFYYVTLMNENYAQPDLPAGVEADVVQGCYKFASYSRTSDEGKNPISSKAITLLGSGAILTEVIQAAQQLAAQGVDVTVYSVTSWSELAREGRVCEQRRVAWLLWGGCGEYCAGGFAAVVFAGLAAIHVNRDVPVRGLIWQLRAITHGCPLGQTGLSLILCSCGARLGQLDVVLTSCVPAKCTF